MNKAKILVIEDDKAIRNLITTTLEIQEYEYHIAKTGTAGMLDVVSYRPDVILLDLGLPDMDGIEIIKKVRSFSNIPIIVVSARNEDQDKVKALDEGADDYLTKPFSIDELLARLRVALRRVHMEQDRTLEESSIYENGELKIDFIACTVHLDGSEIHLTPMEYKMLCLLSKNTGKVLTYNYILREVWGSQVVSDISSMRVFMATLRKKIEKNPQDPKFIQTHIGIGYRMLRISSNDGMEQLNI